MAFVTCGKGFLLWFYSKSITLVNLLSLKAGSKIYNLDLESSPTSWKKVIQSTEIGVIFTTCPESSKLCRINPNQVASLERKYLIYIYSNWSSDHGLLFSVAFLVLWDPFCLQCLHLAGLFETAVETTIEMCVLNILISHFFDVWFELQLMKCRICEI